MLKLNFKCAMSDKARRIDKALRAVNARLRNASPNSAGYYAAKAERRDLLDQLLELQQKIQLEPKLRLTKQQRQALDHRCKIEEQNHERQIQRLTEQGFYDEARRWRLQALDIRERMIKEMGFGGRDAA